VRTRRVLAAALVTATIMAPLPSGGAEGKCPRPAPKSEPARWPAPPEKNAFDIVHFGEGHWNEGQGPKTMPILVQDVKSFGPRFVAFSSDMADIGTPDRLGCFRDLMQPLVDADIPWFDSPGNHDRVAVAGPGGVANGSIDIWRNVFAGMPSPWGDAPAPDGHYVLPEDEPDDDDGASTHYYFDYGPRGKPALRLIVLDNSQHSLTSSDEDQYPAVGPGAKDAGQLAFMSRVATDAQDKGLLSMVMMHQPTQDPRDPSNVYPVSANHTMGKGASTDNLAFDLLADQAGVDGVLLGHIQGNALYSFGDVEYFIDGGGGGSPYALREVGTDTGYYYGFRVLRVFRSDGEWTYRSYFVPLVDRIEIEAPKEVEVGASVDVKAVAVQPFDPDLPPRLSGTPNEAIRLDLHHVGDASVPELAYVWRSSDPTILRPVVDDAIDPVDDPAFEEATMTTTGRFEAVGTGTVRLIVVTGTHAASVTVKVTS